MEIENTFEYEIPQKLSVNSVSFKVTQDVPESTFDSEFVCIIKKKKDAPEVIRIESKSKFKNTNNKTLF